MSIGLVKGVFDTMTRRTYQIPDDEVGAHFLGDDMEFCFGFVKSCDAANLMKVKGFSVQYGSFRRA